MAVSLKLRGVAKVGVLFFALGAACSRFGALYPPRPPASPAPPIADPAPSRIVAHMAVTSAGLRALLEDAVPKDGGGDFVLLGGQRHYTWERTPLELGFDRGLIVLDTHVTAHIETRLANLVFGLDLHVNAEPVVNSEYKVKMQSARVGVTSPDRRLKMADSVASVFDTIGDQVRVKLKDFSYDLRPMIEEAFTRVNKPIDLPVGDATACAELKVLSVEAGPTVVADGIEKDVALVIAPSVTLPCASPDRETPLPPLANVATLQPGPFTVTIPIAARYDELTRAMSVAFTDGKLFFSTDYPKLYLENPELYESQGEVVLKLHIAGPVHKFGIDADLNGDLFLSGHLAIVDNELQVPDLEPTIETKNFLLSLKAMADSDKIRDQARAALRLDIGERLVPVRERLSSGLLFGTAQACFHGSVDKIEVTGAYAHGTYIRVYVAVTARANVSVPCQTPR